MNISKPMKSDDIWLHQEHCNDDSMLIHIGSIEKNFFKNVTIYKFNKGNVIDKIFAEHAEIQEKKWILKQGMMVNHSSGDLVSFKEEEFQTSINDKVLKNYSKDPQDMGFFELFKMFKLRRKIEVVAKSYELNMNFLVATSVLIPVVVLVSALFCFPLDRSRTRVLSVPGAIFSGLLIYFLMSIFRSLGSSGALPIWVSAWTPVLLTIFCSIYLLIKEEES